MLDKWRPCVISGQKMHGHCELASSRHSRGLLDRLVIESIYRGSIRVRASAGIHSPSVISADCYQEYRLVLDSVIARSSTPKQSPFPSSQRPKIAPLFMCWYACWRPSHFGWNPMARVIDKHTWFMGQWDWILFYPLPKTSIVERLFRFESERHGGYRWLKMDSKEFLY